MHYWVHKEAAASPRARISFFKNGKFQGYAFEDIESGRASFVFVVGLFCLYTRSLLTAIPCDRCMIELTAEPPAPINPKILNEGTKYVRTYVCMYVYTYIQTYIHTYLRIYIHTYADKPQDP